MVRSAFTLIELIFAITVISIAVISLPTMNQSITQGIEANIVQEAIFAASTELNQAVTANWDESSLEIGALNSLARVIDDGNCENNTSNARYRLKDGHINQPLHRRCLDNNATGISNASTNNDISSLDDMDSTYAITNANIATGSGYKFDYTTNISVTQDVRFGVDISPNQNIKSIQAVINTGGKEIASLITYSANIGEVDYYKRNYQ